MNEEHYKKMDHLTKARQHAYSKQEVDRVARTVFKKYYRSGMGLYEFALELDQAGVSRDTTQLALVLGLEEWMKTKGEAA